MMESMPGLFQYEYRREPTCPTKLIAADVEFHGAPTRGSLVVCVEVELWHPGVAVSVPDATAGTSGDAAMRDSCSGGACWFRRLVRCRLLRGPVSRLRSTLD